MDLKYLETPQIDLSLFSRQDWFDNSSIETFLDCNRLGYYQYHLGLSSNSPAMAAGTVLHKAIETYHTTKNEQQASIALLKEYGINQRVLIEGANKYTPGNLQRVFEEYVQRFMSDTLIYHAQEVKFAVRVKMCQGNDPFCSCAWDSPSRCFWLVGRCDGMVTYNGELYILENKTTGTLKNFSKGLFISRQATTYIWAIQQILNANGYQRRLRGVLYNAIGFGTQKVEFERFPVIRSIGQLADFQDELLRNVADIRESYVDFPNQNPRWKPKQNTRQCTRYGNCTFMDLCRAWYGRDINSPPELISTYKTGLWRPF